MTAIIPILIMMLLCLILMNAMTIPSLHSLASSTITCDEDDENEAIVLHVYPDLTYVNVHVYQYVPWCEHALDGHWYMGRSKEYGYTVLCHWHNDYYYRDIMMPTSSGGRQWHWSGSKPYSGDISINDVYYTIDTSEEEWLACMEDEDLGSAYYPDPIDRNYPYPEEYDKPEVVFVWDGMEEDEGPLVTDHDDYDYMYLAPVKRKVKEPNPRHTLHCYRLSVKTGELIKPHEYIVRLNRAYESKDWPTWYDLMDNWQTYWRREALHRRNNGRKPKNKHRVVDMTILPTITTSTGMADAILKAEQEECMWEDVAIDTDELWDRAYYSPSPIEFLCARCGSNACSCDWDDDDL